MGAFSAELRASSGTHQSFPDETMASNAATPPWCCWKKKKKKERRLQRRRKEDGAQGFLSGPVFHLHLFVGRRVRLAPPVDFLYVLGYRSNFASLPPLHAPTSPIPLPTSLPASPAPSIAALQCRHQWLPLALWKAFTFFHLCSSLVCLAEAFDPRTDCQ